jgi:hypothetical protein
MKNMKIKTFIVSGALLVLPVFAAGAADLASTDYVHGAIDSLADVARTGSYLDLTDRPDISDLAQSAIDAAVADGAIGDAIDAAVVNAVQPINQALEGKANLVTGPTQSLQAVGSAGVFAIVDGEGQPQRGFTVGDLASHVQASVDTNIPHAVADAMAAELAEKQDLVGDGNVDSEPTIGSNRIVTSGGVASAIEFVTANVAYEIETITTAIDGLGALADLDTAARANLAADVTTSLDRADTALQAPAGCIGQDCALVRQADGNFQWFRVATVFGG